MDPNKLHRIFSQEQERLLGRRAIQRGWITDDQLRQALAQQIKQPDKRLGEILIDLGWLRQDQLLELITEEPPQVRAHLSDPARRIAEFVLVEPLGQGGLAKVWKAWDRALGRWVAVKVPTAPMDSDLWERFQREALAASRLSHPNIVPVYRVAEDAGRPYIVMQLVQGRRLSDANLTIPEALEAIRSAAAAVHAAHAAGVVHRDLKPDNLMLDDSKRVWILDFGLAFLNEGRRRLTASGAVFGTPAYMSPEQAMGDPRSREPATDIYSLGASLYELVTGAPPFEGETMAEIVHKVVERPVAAPRKLNPRLSRDVETVLLKALDKVPSRRYCDAAAFAEDLRRCLAGEPILARRPRRFRLVAAVALAALAVVFWMRWWEPRPPERRESPSLVYVEVQDRVTGARRYLYKPGAVIADIRRELEPVLARLDESLRRSPHADGHYLKGRIDHLLGDSASASASFELALELDPDHALSHLYLARLLLERSVLESSLLLDERRVRSRLSDMVEDAREHLERASASASFDEKDVELARGYALLARRQYAEARTLAGRHRDEEFDFLAGLASLGEDKFDEAIGHFTAAIQGRTNYFEAYYMRGGCYQLSGRPEPMIADFNKCIEIHPGYPYPWNNLGAWHERQNDLDRAFECLTRSIAADPNFVTPHVNLASVLRGLGRHDEALAVLDRALKIDPLYYASYYQRGLTLFNAGRLVPAREAFDACLELCPAHPRALANRGEVYLQMGKPDEAIRDFTEALSAVRDWSLYHNRAQARMMRGDWEGAVGDLTRAIELNDKSALSFSTRGTAELRLRRYAEAVRDFERAVTLDRRLQAAVGPQLAEARRRLRRQD